MQRLCLPAFPSLLCDLQLTCTLHPAACSAIKRIRDDTQGGSLHYMHVDLASLK